MVSRTTNQDKRESKGLLSQCTRSSREEASVYCPFLRWEGIISSYTNKPIKLLYKPLPLILNYILFKSSGAAFDTRRILELSQRPIGYPYILPLVTYFKLTYTIKLNNYMYILAP